jgi:hypothetical protein
MSHLVTFLIVRGFISGASPAAAQVRPSGGGNYAGKQGGKDQADGQGGG